ncbi:DUF1173 family protein [Achromobacter aegrifaciens]|uniref:DUF1173 family protein n=1 Tax=Achromobacter aegrifaciens TaxID=1287736 RepID=A0ABU2DF50_ACHAE|nr:DUF1173 family protein [Achromobacter aegrifaciens]MDR7946657.1 DUF1173 family protein [Achromobacter aegrifaciens]
MDRTLYPVEIALGEKTQIYSPEFQSLEEHVAGWKRVLLLSHGKADVRCCCLGPGQKRLSIHSRANSDRFHLARFPETGPDHSEDCIYYGVDPGMSGLGGYRRGVVQELDDGNTKIKLKVGLQQRPTAAPEEENAAAGADKKMATARSRSGQASMTLLGLLHYLWTEAGFNAWAPSMNGKRSVGLVHYHLLRVASSTFAGRVRLSSNLVIAATAADGQQAALNRAKSTEAMNRRRRLVAIAPLAQYQPGMEAAGRLPIMGFHGIPHLTLSAEDWEVLQRRFMAEVNGWMSGDMVIAIAQTDVPTPAAGSMKARVVDLALMTVTPQWIPVDSGYEAAVVAALVAAERRFEKPLRFDAGTEQVFPDFWLRDRSDIVPMEVWGLTDQDYAARKEQKIAHYDEKYGPGKWWQWDAAAGAPIPPFP